MTYVYFHGQPVSKIEGNALYFYHNDHLGTPMMMTDQNRNIVWQAEHLPFGEPQSITGTITNNLRFAGQYYDAETGLHYNYFRDCMPEIGRYIEKDPIGLDGGTNLHVYVGNGPGNRTDPSGLISIGFGFGGGGNVGTIGAGADSGVVMDSNGSLCFYTNTCFSLGWNTVVGGSIGGVGQISSGKLCSGVQKCKGGYWYGGAGVEGEVEALVCDGSDFHLGRGIGGPSEGAGAGYIQCETRLYCINEPPECKCGK